MKNLSTTARLVALAAYAAGTSSRSDAAVTANQAADTSALVATPPPACCQLPSGRQNSAVDASNSELPSLPARRASSSSSCEESLSPWPPLTEADDGREHVAEPLRTGAGRAGRRIPWAVERFPRGGGRGGRGSSGGGDDDTGKPSSPSSTAGASSTTDIGDGDGADDDRTEESSKRARHKKKESKNGKRPETNATKHSPGKDGAGKGGDDISARSKGKAAAKDTKKAPKRDDPNTTTRKTGRTAPAPPAPNAIVEEILRWDGYYDVLGVAHTASEREIQKAYRKRCVQTHPDKTGGDRRAFDKVAEAYDVLSDPQRRQQYNQFGKSAPGLGHHAGGAAAAGSFQDMFRGMFEQAQEQVLRRQQAEQRRNRTLRYQLQVTLEDLYSGKTQTVVVTPPFHPHSQRGVDERGRRHQKQVDVHIPMGSMSGQSIVMPGEVDFQSDTTPGDLVFIVTQVPHPTFTRKGHDLAMELTIDLEEAVCGFQRPVRHLDGNELWIESAKAEPTSTSGTGGKGIPNVIRTGDIQVLKGWGMPKRNRSGEYGDLYVQFRVEMPKAKSGTVLTEEERMELSRLLTKLQGTTHLLHRGSNHRQKKETNNKDTSQHPEIHTLHEAKTSDFGTASGRVIWEEADEGTHEDQGDDFHPFASAASSFFQQSGNRGRRSFYYGGNFGSHDPFGSGGGADPDPHGEDGNVQCQHM